MHWDINNKKNTEFSVKDAFLDFNLFYQFELYGGVLVRISYLKALNITLTNIHNRLSTDLLLVCRSLPSLNMFGRIKKYGLRYFRLSESKYGHLQI